LTLLASSPSQNTGQDQDIGQGDIEGEDIEGKDIRGQDTEDIPGKFL